MSIEAPQLTPGVYHDFEDLFALVEFYHALPTDAIIATLQARGLQDVVKLHHLADALLISLAIHTHTPRWQSLWKTQGPKSQEGKKLHSILLDLPL